MRLFVGFIFIFITNVYTSPKEEIELATKSIKQDDHSYSKFYVAGFGSAAYKPKFLGPSLFARTVVLN